MASKPETSVQPCVPSVSLKLLDIYNEMSGHLAAASVETEPDTLTLKMIIMM